MRNYAIDRPEPVPYDPENLSHVAWMVLWLTSQGQANTGDEVCEYLENRDHPTYSKEFFCSLFPEAFAVAESKQERVTA